MEKIPLITLLVLVFLGSLSALVAFRQPLAEMAGFQLGVSNDLAGPALPITPPSDDARPCLRMPFAEKIPRRRVRLAAGLQLRIGRVSSSSAKLWAHARQDASS